MANDIVMPRLSDSMEEGTVLEWLVAEGDEVRRGQPLVEIETDKATMTYEADVDGVILKIVVGRGETAALGEPIAIVGAAGERVEGRAVRAHATAGGNGAPASVASTTSTASAEEDGAATRGRPSTGSARNGSGAAPTGTSAASGAGRVAASPLARRTAHNLGVDLAGIQGTGPNGRVVRADVEAAAAAPAGESVEDAVAERATATAPSTAAAVGHPAGEGARTESRPGRAPEAAPATDARGETEIHELTRLQQTVARRMAESHATVPYFELHADVDLSACVELRERLRELSADQIPSYNDMIVKASALALREFPRVNGSYKDGRFEEYARVNVGVAVAAEDALVVPTVFDADTRSLASIARTTRELAEKVRDRTVTPPELAGATFTVSNLGMFGIDSFSAIINVPQAAILAVGSLKKRPLVDERDRIVVRPTVTLTLVCDHRILYGADGARFLARVRELLEQPLAFAL
ncbi:MAG TPA: dihydrolipoamide acetyltransferase family protein [Thermoleophilaceae bacterium]|nr:dihydrolipoamide acetyltransferase family protein [Thermoleophilaceae bacterium]